jgi:hypothetical protein
MKFGSGKTIYGKLSQFEKMTTAKLTLTPEEAEELKRTGFLRIDDPERGEIEISGEAGRAGLKGSQGRVKIIRSGIAAMRPE